MRKTSRSSSNKTQHRRFCAAAAGFCFLCALPALPAQEARSEPPDGSAQISLNAHDLLAGYLSRDIALAEQALALEEAKIRAGKTRLEQEINIQLSSGTMKMRFVPENSSFEFAPALTAEFPRVNDSSITATVPFAIDSNQARTENTAISVSTAIISAKGAQRQAELLTAERAVITAERAFKAQGFKSEKAFYGELQTVYESMSEMLSLLDAQYAKELDFASARAQGFSPLSAKYRTAGLEAASAKRAADEAERSFTRAVESFSRKCGRELKAANVLALRIDGADTPQNFDSFAKESFISIEEAAWQREAGEKTRQAKTRIELGASAGVTFNNTSIAKNTSVDGGLSLSWRGLSVTLGASIPLKNTAPNDGAAGNSLNAQTQAAPVFQGTIKINPFDFKTAALDKQQDALSVQKELLAITKANDAYDDAAMQSQKKLSDILWRENERKIQAELYAELARDMEIWHERGVISETEYRKALTNNQKAQLALVQTALEKIIFNIDTTLAFIIETEK
jgi:hypothetical protein